MTVESGPHPGLDKAFVALQQLRRRAHVLPDVVWLPSEAQVWALNQPVGLKPRMIVKAATIQLARKAKGGRGLVAVAARDVRSLQTQPLVSPETRVACATPHKQPIKQQHAAAPQSHHIEPQPSLQHSCQQQQEADEREQGNSMVEQQPLQQQQHTRRRPQQQQRAPAAGSTRPQQLQQQAPAAQCNRQQQQGGDGVIEPSRTAQQPQQLLQSQPLHQQPPHEQSDQQPVTADTLSPVPMLQPSASQQRVEENASPQQSSQYCPPSSHTAPAMPQSAAVALATMPVMFPATPLQLSAALQQQAPNQPSAPSHPTVHATILSGSGKAGAGSECIGGHEGLLEAGTGRHARSKRRLAEQDVQHHGQQQKLRPRGVQRGSGRPRV